MPASIEINLKDPDWKDGTLADAVCSCPEALKLGGTLTQEV
jgi:hypothetical protein